ncbi:hypothetical protein [Devosia sp. 2618]|uniref:hypothetical protein n=1 Tax=Devosia sp. 2618 TaxID=3156454 RepID=UPI0033947CF8
MKLSRGSVAAPKSTPSPSASAPSTAKSGQIDRRAQEKSRLNLGSKFGRYFLVFRLLQRIRQHKNQAMAIVQ